VDSKDKISKLISQSNKFKENIFCSDVFNIQKVIGDPLEIQEWMLQGLPLDNVSIENAIYMKETTL